MCPFRSIRNVCIWFTTCQIVFLTAVWDIHSMWFLFFFSAFFIFSFCGLNLIASLLLLLLLLRAASAIAGTHTHTYVSLTLLFLLSRYLRSAISIAYIFLSVRPFIYLVCWSIFVRCSRSSSNDRLCCVYRFIYLHNELLWSFMRMHACMHSIYSPMLTNIKRKIKSWMRKRHQKQFETHIF